MVYLSVFFLGIAIFLGIVALSKDITSDNDVLEKRMEGKDLNRNSSKYEELFNEKDKNLSYREKVERDITRSGLDLKMQEYMYLIVASIFTLFTISLVIFHGRLFPSILTSFLGFFFPKVFLKYKYKIRLKKFNSQLVDTLRTLISSLRGGLSLEQSIYNLAESAPSPTKEEFEKVADDLKYGKNLEDALQGLQNRINDSDMDLIMTVILIQKEIGGDLTKSLDSIANTIEERIKLKSDLKALTSNGKLSAIIIGSIPIVLFAGLNLVDSTYFTSFFNHPLGIILFGIAIILDLVGVLFSVKLATPEINEI